MKYLALILFALWFMTQALSAASPAESDDLTGSSTATVEAQIVLSSFPQPAF